MGMRLEIPVVIYSICKNYYFNEELRLNHLQQYLKEYQ
jgi:hypothetical protein